MVLTALFSINAGQAVTFYTAQFYVLFFLTQVLRSMAAPPTVC